MQDAKMNSGWGAKLIIYSNSAEELCSKHTLRGEPYRGMPCGESTDFSLMLEKTKLLPGKEKTPLGNTNPLGDSARRKQPCNSAEEHQATTLVKVNQGDRAGEITSLGSNRTLPGTIG
jgi:hypothetical protein